MANKKLRIFVAAAAAALLLAAAGCGTSQAQGDSAKLDQDKYARISDGMTSSEVKTIAGAPSRTESESMGGGHQMGDGSSMSSTMSREYWYYQGDKGWVRLEMTDGKVTGKSGY